MNILRKIFNGESNITTESNGAQLSFEWSHLSISFKDIKKLEPHYDIGNLWEFRYDIDTKTLSLNAFMSRIGEDQ